MRHGRRSTLSAGPKPAGSGSAPIRRGQIRWLPVRGRGYGPSVTRPGPARPGPSVTARPRRGAWARVLHWRTNLHYPARCGAGSSPHRLSLSVAEARLPRHSRPTSSTVVSNLTHLPQKSSISPFCSPPENDCPGAARPGVGPPRRGPTRPDPTRRRPAPARPGAARSDPAQPGGHDLGTPPISKTRVVSRRCTFSETAPRRARSGSTGPVPRAHGASHRGHR